MDSVLQNAALAGVNKSTIFFPFDISASVDFLKSDPASDMQSGCIRRNQYSLLPSLISKLDFY